MRIIERRVGGVTILDLQGSLVHLEGDEPPIKAFYTIFNRGERQLLVNCEGVQRIDNEGIHALVAMAFGLAGRGGTIKLLHVPAAVDRALTATKLTKVLEIFDDEADALRSFPPQTSVVRYSQGSFEPLQSTTADVTLLDLTSDVVAAIKSIADILDNRGSQKDIGALLSSADWRDHLIAAIAVLPLRHPASLAPTLWDAVDRGSWVSPQLIVALSLCDPQFVQRARQRIIDRCPVRVIQFTSAVEAHAHAGPGRSGARSAKNCAALLHALHTIPDEAEWAATESRATDVSELIRAHREMVGQIMDSWEASLRWRFAELGLPLPEGSGVVIDVEVVDGAVTLLPRGKLTYELLADMLDRQIGEGYRRFNLDLKMVPDVDGEGLGELIRAYTFVTQRGGRLRLRHVPKRVADILAITKLSSFLFDDTSDEDPPARIAIRQKPRTPLHESGATVPIPLEPDPDEQER